MVFPGEEEKNLQKDSKKELTEEKVRGYNGSRHCWERVILPFSRRSGVFARRANCEPQPETAVVGPVRRLEIK